MSSGQRIVWYASMNMKNVTDELRSILIENGADAVGFADLNETAISNTLGFPFGIPIIVRHSATGLADLIHGCTRDYYTEYQKMNKLLGELCVL